MRIALTGASSTGKTTLLEDLLETPFFRAYGISNVKLDVRKTIELMRIKAGGVVGEQNRQREFQWGILKKKLILEDLYDNYATDRSTVDMAAYWLVRDTDGNLDEESKNYLSKCKVFASRYDFHVHLPFGAIPFVEDGQRPSSELFNKRTCDTIKNLLKQWNLPHISLVNTGRKERIDEIISFLKNLK